MEHEVFVPVPAEALRVALRDPARVARCVPGLQRDADESAGPISGRLRIRVGGHTITYRGSLRVTEQDDERGGAFAVEGEGSEVRGTGSVKLALTIRPAPADGGTSVIFTGSAGADGRLAELAAGTKESTAHRLLERFAEALAAAAFDDPQSEAGSADDAPGGRTGGGAADATGAGAVSPGAGADAGATEAEGAEARDDGGESVFDAPVPPPSLGADADEEFDDLDDLDDVDGLDDLDDLEGIDQLDELSGAVPAEAAHARRTMIGRSAEEVDHAPPRGRYAPTPAPDTGSAGETLRWLVPAAALALASAVAIGRALRRRR